MISVIVPVYNGAADGGALLRECLDSIVTQQGADFELLAIDDGSTDDTAEILAGYAGKYPFVRVFGKVNGGVSSARNLGVSRALGEYVCFVDADDCLLPGALSAFAASLRRTEAPVIIGTAAADRHRVAAADGSFGIKEYGAADYAARTLYQRGGHNSPWAMLVRRGLLEAEPFDETMRYEDLELSCRLYLRAGLIAVIDSPVYFYRHNPASFLNSWTPARADSLRATAAIEKYVAANEPCLLPAARDRRLSANFNVFILASLNGAGQPLTEQCWKQIRQYRRESLFNRRVRLKNKLGIILSYLGRRPLLSVAKMLN